jgi:hypothetical protein
MNDIRWNPYPGVPLPPMNDFGAKALKAAFGGQLGDDLAHFITHTKLFFKTPPRKILGFSSGGP